MIDDTSSEISYAIQREWNLNLEKNIVSRLVDSEVDDQQEDTEDDDDAIVNRNLTPLERIKNRLLNTDIRKLGLSSQFTTSPASINTYVVKEPIFCQILKVVDISKPSRLASLSETSSRMLMINLHDGGQKFSAVEIEQCKVLSLATPPGTKLLLQPSQNAPSVMRNGTLLLRPSNFKILGGVVKRMIENWKVTKNVLLSRSCKHHVNIEDGAPRFVSFPIGARPPRLLPNTQKMELTTKTQTSSTPIRQQIQSQSSLPTPVTVSRQKTKSNAFQNVVTEKKQYQKRGKRFNDDDETKSRYLVNKTRPQGTLFDAFSVVLPSLDQPTSVLSVSHQAKQTHTSEEFPSLDPTASIPDFPLLNIPKQEAARHDSYSTQRGHRDNTRSRERDTFQETSSYRGRGRRGGHRGERRGDQGHRRGGGGGGKRY